LISSPADKARVQSHSHLDLFIGPIVCEYCMRSLHFIGPV